MYQSKFFGWMLTLTVAMLIAASAWADDDDERSEHRYHGESRGKGISPVKNKLYQSECGACHFAFQPGFLPADSWQKMMGSLDQHFGENAELVPQKRDAIRDYLVANASTRKISGSPQRITELSFFRREHREIPDRLVKGNPKVRSLANCQTCHTGAANADFNEHRVSIPGYGRWDD